MELKQDTFWKDQYKDMWGEGVARCKAIIKKMETWGHTVEEFGFMPLSTKYYAESPDEKGKPDFKVITKNGKEILLEVTGCRNMAGSDIWIRVDKFKYAENHPEFECWIGHYVDHELLARFIKLENRVLYNIKSVQIRGNTETFVSIPLGSSAIVSAKDFRDKVLA